MTLYREQQQVILDIEDRGIGIPQEEIEHIFQSFYRGSNTRDYAGQGIGLSLTLKIISAYHAKLDISSEIEKGTKVRVIFNHPSFIPFSLYLLKTTNLIYERFSTE